MKRHQAFLSLAIVLGGAFATISSSSTQQHRDTMYHHTELESAPLTWYVVSMPAYQDHTPCEVIRPRTPMLRIDHGDTVVDAFITPVVPVAHGPPKYC